MSSRSVGITGNDQPADRALIQVSRGGASKMLVAAKLPWTDEGAGWNTRTYPGD